MSAGATVACGWCVSVADITMGAEISANVVALVLCDFGNLFVPQLKQALAFAYLKLRELMVYFEELRVNLLRVAVQCHEAANLEFGVEHVEVTLNPIFDVGFLEALLLKSAEGRVAHRLALPESPLVLAQLGKAFDNAIHGACEKATAFNLEAELLARYFFNITDRVACLAQVALESFLIPVAAIEFAQDLPRELLLADPVIVVPDLTQTRTAKV